jgi:ABC-type antimicrobial peptide transport system permease subunit
LTEGDSPTRISAASISASFFSVFDLHPQLGRPLVVDDGKPGNSEVAIMSDRLWTQNFFRNPGVIGQTITLNSVKHTIVGVMQPGLEFPGRTDIWIPQSTGTAAVELGRDFQSDLPLSIGTVMVGRLRPDTSPAQAEAELELLFAAMKETYAKTGTQFGDRVEINSLHERLVENYRPALLSLFAGTGLLLLVACANAVSLLLVRAARRRKEIAIRLCLGAGPLQIVRQLLTESLVLAMASGIAGVIFAIGGINAIRVIGSKYVLGPADIHIDGVVLVFALCTSLFVGVIVGIAPALQASSSFREVLNEAGVRSMIGFRPSLRRGIIIGEVAFALVLVVGAGLSIRGFFRLTNVDPGLDPTDVMTVSVALPVKKYGRQPLTLSQQPTNNNTNTKRASAELATANVPPPSSQYHYPAFEFHRRLLDETRRLQGVVAVGGVTQLPLSNKSGRSLYIEALGSQGGLAQFYSITGDYFRALSVPILRGRAFSELDSENSQKVVIINEKAARQFLGEKNPIGESIVVGDEGVPREIVGVVGDVRQRGLSKKTEPQFYLPYLQSTFDGQPSLDVALVIRTSGDPFATVGHLRSLLKMIDKDLPIFQIRTMEGVIADSASDYRFRGLLSGIFALFALLLVVTGAYGVVSYTVESRTHEIGIRMCLGARPRDVLLGVLKEGAVLSIVGVSIGIVASYGLNRFIGSLLFGINADDPSTLITSALAIIVAVLLASLIPAFRASRANPAIVLKTS